MPRCMKRFFVSRSFINRLYLKFANLGNRVEGRLGSIFFIKTSKKLCHLCRSQLICGQIEDWPVPPPVRGRLGGGYYHKYCYIYPSPFLSLTGRGYKEGPLKWRRYRIVNTNYFTYIEIMIRQRGNYDIEF